MLARIAQELFWLGRHVARAEHTARMLDGVFQTDLAGAQEDPRGVELTWPGLLAILGAKVEGLVGRDEALAQLTLDADEPASLISCVARAREGARTVRDVISADMWEVANTTHLVLNRDDLSGQLLSSPYSVYRYVKERSALFWGLTGRTMLRDDANWFLDAGGRIESADMVLRMLRVALPVGRDDEPRTGQAQALLQAVGGLQAFRRAVPSPPNAVPAARFLLYERSYPDSVAASVASALRSLEEADPQPRNSAPVLRLSRLSAELEFRRRGDDPSTDLVAVCEQVQRELALVDADIALRYFATAAPPVAAVAR
ncbi:MAG: alpha-E protein [Solirubrobacteraceae bacterium]|nr:alpha-E protein [Solirubrobacteraceae bacterium]